MSVTATAASVDFADVYGDNLDKVWRFVRARIRDDHDAHDVTADVFVRAWRSWDRYDPDRGPVEPWLFTIAYRTIADRLRRSGREHPVEPGDLPEPDRVDGPEHALLRDELLTQLARALDGLTQRERDGLALRFAARLSMAHVADVLGTSVGAAKMMIHRAIRTLEQQVDLPAPAEQGPADLEAVIDDVLARGHETIGDSQLHGMLVHLAAEHDRPTPEGLSDHVAHCVRCAVEEDLDSSSGPTVTGNGHADPGSGTSEERSRLAGIAAALLAFTGVCLVCTVPAIQTLLWAVGVGVAGYYMHLVGLAAVPFVLWLVWRGTRRHGIDRGYRWARAGAITMAIHALLHVALQTVPASTSSTLIGTLLEPAFVVTDWVGTALLIAGATLNLADLHRWRRAQAAGLRTLLAS